MERLQEGDAFAALDVALVDWLSDGGGFVWTTPADSSGGVPPSRVHTFPTDRVKFSARVDFFRGENADDPGNRHLDDLLGHLPRLRELKEGPYHVLDRSYNLNNRGNFVESCLGGSFAVSSGRDWPGPGVVKSLRPGGEELMRRVWAAFQRCGFGPTITPPPPTSPSPL